MARPHVPRDVRLHLGPPEAVREERGRRGNPAVSDIVVHLYERLRSLLRLEDATMVPITSYFPQAVVAEEKLGSVLRELICLA